MARESLRPEIEIYHVSGLLRQALSSCRSSVWLFLTLALVSALYEEAVERSAVVPGFSFSSSNSNLSFQFSFDTHQPAQASLHRHTTGGVLRGTDHQSIPVQEQSFFSRVLSLIFPSGVLPAKLEEFRGGDFGEEPGEATVGLSESINEDPAFSEVSNNMREERYEPGKEDSSPELRDLTHFEAHKSSEKNPHQVGERGFPRETRATLNAGSDDAIQAEEITVTDAGKKDNVFSLPRLKMQMPGNETTEDKGEALDESIDLMLFTGKLLGGRGLDQGAMPQGGMTMLLMFLILAGALTIFLAVVGFQHAAVLGSVAYSVVSTHMGKRANIRQAIRAGFRSGLGRLMWLAILHATLRGIQSLFFMKTLFGGVMEMEQVEQLVLRLSVTPFAFLAPFRDVEATDLEMQVRLGLFVVLDYIFDGLVYCFYVVACWVTIMERNFWGLGALSRSWNLVKSMELQALTVKALEAVICGRTCRWLLSQIVGQFSAALAICMAQVYFLVVWLIFYLSARSLHDGQSQFSYRNLEDFLDRFK